MAKVPASCSARAAPAGRRRSLTFPASFLPQCLHETHTTEQRPVAVGQSLDGRLGDGLLGLLEGHVVVGREQPDEPLREAQAKPRVTDLLPPLHGARPLARASSSPASPTSRCSSWTRHSCGTSCRRSTPATDYSWSCSPSAVCGSGRERHCAGVAAISNALGSQLPRTPSTCAESWSSAARRPIRSKPSSCRTSSPTIWRNISLLPAPRTPSCSLRHAADPSGTATSFVASGSRHPRRLDPRDGGTRPPSHVRCSPHRTGCPSEGDPAPPRPPVDHHDTGSIWPLFEDEHDRIDDAYRSFATPQDSAGAGVRLRAPSRLR